MDNVLIEDLDSDLLDYTPTGKQKIAQKYQGNIRGAEFAERETGATYLKFFQYDRNGERKGVAQLTLQIEENMIKNEWQLKITKGRITEFETELNKLTGASASGESVHVKMQADALSNDIQTMRAEVAEYEKLKMGKIKVLTAHSFHELPEIIIKARIARSMTQKQLAESLGMKEQQIQRYESTNYASASFTTIERVIGALGVTVEEKATLG